MGKPAPTVSPGAGTPSRPSWAIQTVDAWGNTARLERDELGRVTAAISPSGLRTEYRYDQAGRLVSRRDPDGARWAYEHTTGGRICAVIDPMGGRTSIEHGPAGARERVVDAVGRAVMTGYDDVGNLARVELPDGTSWQFGYDAASRLVDTTDAAGGVWQLKYGPNGQVSTGVDATGVVREATSGTFGLPTRFDDGADQVSAGYDRLGRMVSVTGADGRPVLRRYDLCGRLVETVDAGGGVTRIERDLAGRVVWVTQPLGGRFGYEYDEGGRWAATISTGGDRYQMHYDQDSRIVGETWPTGEQVHTVLDECGRVAERREPGRGTTRFRYDKCGRIVAIQDPWVGQRHFGYDLAGQLVWAKNAVGGVTRYEYDELGRQVGVVDPLGGRTTRGYDQANRLVSQTDPLGRTTRWDYDLAGRPTRRTEATGASVQWCYDHTGRLSQTLADDTVLSTLERDFAARTMRVVEGDTVHDLGWDPDGNLLYRLRDGVGMRYTYDAAGRRETMTRPDQTTTRYRWDDNHRLASISLPGLGEAVLGRDALGRVTGLDADGLHSEWTYTDGYLQSRDTNRRGFLTHTRFERDDQGRIAAQTIDGTRTVFGYDPAGQLVSSLTSEGLESRYTWDANGRLVTETSNGRTTGHTYDAAGQLLTTTSEQGTFSYDYDQAGRRIRQVGAGSEELYSWDPQGFLSRVTRVSHGLDEPVVRTRDLHVDALGELSRVGTTSVWWDTAAGLPTVAQLGDDAVTATGLGTVLTGPDGQPSWSLPGTEASPWSIPGTSAGTPGLEVSADGGLQIEGLGWLGARVYDPASRIMLSTDPLRPVTAAGWAANPYSYAGNDPVNQADPLGLSPVTDQQLQAYRDGNRGALGSAMAAASDWWGENWEYVAAGALIVGGIGVCQINGV